MFIFANKLELKVFLATEKDTKKRSNHVFSLDCVFFLCEH